MRRAFPRLLHTQKAVTQHSTATQPSTAKQTNSKSTNASGSIHCLTFLSMKVHCRYTQNSVAEPVPPNLTSMKPRPSSWSRLRSWIHASTALYRTGKSRLWAPRPVMMRHVFWPVDRKEVTPCQDHVGVLGSHSGKSQSDQSPLMYTTWGHDPVPVRTPAPRLQPR